MSSRESSISPSPPLSSSKTSSPAKSMFPLNTSSGVALGPAGGLLVEKMKMIPPLQMIAMRKRCQQVNAVFAWVL
ncbi:hypothetical protein SCLCIDRAFT_1215163 [Scleroderma citrinum Foug A]|uniref:Uncharacterized protein n=1 Tax=Scleroderma citrinum Foug A TaxID=1036808 RepID=A0A0C3DNS2_9AGAM|nr:hypothetical protein SCLCIDRAFT_1215163 [Scleroderma citrinum Foug A]